MSVEFNDEKQQASLLYARLQRSSKIPGLEEWLISKGIVKDGIQANKLLLTVVVISLIVAGYVLYTNSRPAAGLTPSQKQASQEPIVIDPNLHAQ
jgi:hypothetical protein